MIYKTCEKMFRSLLQPPIRKDGWTERIYVIYNFIYQTQLIGVVYVLTHFCKPLPRLHPSQQFDKFVELRILRKNHITNLGNGDIFFFSSSGSRHSENLKRILGTLEGRWLHNIFPNSRKF